MKKNSPRIYTLVSLGILCLMVLTTTIGVAGGIVLAPRLADSAFAAPIAPEAAAPSPVNTAADDEILAAFETALGNIYDAAVPSVVRLNVTQSRDVSNRPNIDPDPNGFQFPQQGSGSGFVWDKAGHIVTNFHVVEGAEEIDVIFANGTTVSAAVVGTDPDADLAVIKVDLPANSLQPLPVGDMDTLRVGQLTVAIGAPFGQDFTMTSGIVSAIGRSIRSGNTPYTIPEAIQTDAPINPGNSGGPLLNRHGEVIGINTQILSRSGSSSGIGFAVPIDIAKRVVPDLIAFQNYEYAWLGISGQDVSEELAGLMNLPVDTEGTMIIATSDNGPAEDAGLQGSSQEDTVGGFPYRYGGDIITAIEGQPISSINDLIVYLVDKTRPGDKVTLDIIRDGDQITVDVTLGSRPDN